MTNVILDQLPDGVVLIDLEGIILGWMGNAEAIFGYTSHELVGKNLGILFRNAWDKNFLQEMTGAFEKESLFRKEYPCSRKDGTSLLSEVCAKFILDADHNPVGIICSFRDHSMREHLTNERIRLDKQKILGELSGAIAHELNNILTAIMGSLSLTKLYTGGNENLDSIIGDIEDAAKEAAKISKKLLTYSKGGTANGNKIQATQLIQNALQLHRKDQEISFDWAIQNDLELLKLDEGLFSHVFNFLIENACQGMQKGGELRVSISKFSVTSLSNLPLNHGNYIKISFNDTDTGIPPEKLKNAFDPIVTTNTKDKFDGLSLATVYTTIRNLGGIATVESESSRGTTFSIYIPKKDSIISQGE